MEVLQNKTDEELLASIVAEIAKSTNELKCARGDLDKISSRLGFAIAVLNELLYRQDTKE